MTADTTLEAEVARLVAREAYFLDRRRWNDWLDLYAEDAEYWAPAWATEEELTSDPGNELSLICLRGRGGLQDRIFRITARDSLATVPLDRTSHVVGPVVIHKADREIEASCSWITHIYGVRGAWNIGGWSDYTLTREGMELRISKKRVVLIDDRLEIPVDVNHLL